jgi:hypothetical protein
LATMGHRGMRSRLIPNNALNRDAPRLSRSLQGKGRGSPRRAGKRER